MCKLLYIATGDPRLASRLGQLAEELSIEGGDINALYHEICRSVKKRIQYAAQNTSKGEVVTEVEDGNSSHNIHLNVGKLSENTKEARFILNAAYSYPKRPKSAVLSSGEHLITGRSRPATTPHGVQTTKSLINPHLELGSQILLGAQNLARVIALPEQNVALVQMDSVPAPNGSVVVQTRDMEQHYCYVDVNLLEFDVFTGYWRPQGSVGDRVTLQGPTLLTEHGDVTCLEVDKGKSLQETKHQMMIAWVQDVDEKAVKPEEWNSKLSHATKKSRKTDKRTPTNTWGNMTEEKVIAPTTQPPTNAVTLRPLSSMFCEKMDLSLSASVLESGMMPLNIGTDPDIAWTNRQQPHDLQQNSTFLTEEGNLGMEKAQLEINLNLPSETEDLENVRMEMWSTDNESKLYVGRIESVGQYKTDSEFSVQLQRETGTNMDNKTLLNEGYNSDVQQNETPHTEPHRVIANSQDKQNVLQSSVENIVEEQHMKKPTLATIRIPSFESNENETVHTMDPESQNPELSGATVNDDHVMCTSNRNVDNEDSDKEEAEIQTTGISTIIIGSTAVGEDVSLGDDESKLTGTENKSYQNSKQRSSKKTARRVQSARVPENVESKTSSLVTRPYSAVVTRPKHVVFGNNECDSDSRPGSASSFQLQRTEAWRSSASSGRHSHTFTKVLGLEDPNYWHQ
uniref:Uncharacterized protein LOC104265755 n=1 Tax=Phallusia mammillata TaxID=59560 RepID=A0A6F9DJS4_9ASCI|nr:uncharacterized protein LOC104265755 [Phallusia mammillata]